MGLDKSIIMFFCYIFGSGSIGFGLAEMYSIGVGLLSFGGLALLAAAIIGWLLAIEDRS